MRMKEVESNSKIGSIKLNPPAPLRRIHPLRNRTLLRQLPRENGTGTSR